MPPIQEDLIGERVANAKQNGIDMETEEEDAELVPVVEIGAEIEPIVQEVPAANCNKVKNFSSASSLTPSKRFSKYSRKVKSKDHALDDNIVKRRKRLV